MADNTDILPFRFRTSAGNRPRLTSDPRSGFKETDTKTFGADEIEMSHCERRE